MTGDEERHTGRRDKLKPGERYGAAALALVLALVAISCGHQSARSRPEALRAGPADSGSRITLHVGESLSLDLRGHARGPWALSYPRTLLTLTRAAREMGRFHLRATHTGIGKIVALPLGGCGLPTMHGPARKCPLTSQKAEVNDRLGRPFVLTVKIVR